MPVLSAIDLTHLSIFASDLATGRPIVRMPVYAEVAVVVAQDVPVAVDGRFVEPLRDILNDHDPACAGDPACRARLIAAVDRAMARVLAVAARDELAQNPDRARAFFDHVFLRARDANGGAPLGGLDERTMEQRLAAAIREEADRQRLGLNPAPPRVRWTHPLGVLATDHVGYLSFDLTRLPSEIHQAIRDAVAARRQDPQAALETSVLIYAMARDGFYFDALEQARFAPDAIVYKLGIEMPEIPQILRNQGLLTMQRPGLTDWRLSPASFAGNPNALLGRDGCETLLPANVALHEFHFHQVVRLTDLQPAHERLMLGGVHDYRMLWFPLGHSLGQILYSLPLAPGESVNLAVIDWTRSDQTERKEDTKLTEQLVHHQRRDRTITETVNAALNEYQRGSTFMAGLAASGGLGAALGGGIGVAAGLAGSLGGATSSTSGNRDLTANTIQQLTDNIAQSSTAMREFQSTVVVRSTQAEKEAIETRTVANYNHSHTLTILYYEVLRHFRVETRWAGVRPAVLVKEDPPVFAHDDTIITYRFVLERGLLDERLRTCFGAVDKLICLRAEREAAKRTGARNVRFFQFHLEWLSGHNWEDSGQLRFELVLKDGTLVKLNRIAGAGTQADEHYGAPFTRPPGGYADSWLRPQSGNVTFTSIKALRVKFAGMDHVRPERTPFVLGDWVLGAVRMHGSHAQGEERIFDGLLNHYMEVVPGGPPFSEFDVPIASPPDQVLFEGPPASHYELAEADRCCFERLQSHIMAHAAHYTRVVWMNEDPDARARRFEGITLSGIGTLLDVVENRPLDIFGDYVVYPCVHRPWVDDIDAALTNRAHPPIEPLEQLITLPTRGIFAEAMLGHCNASEEIDNTRFWDWQKSPIPHFATQIMPIQAVTPKPAQQDASPTPFPSSLVNIVAPPSAPDPTGLAAALTAIATPNIFRDMSGRAEVAGLLKGLSDNTIDIAQAANKAREIQAKYGGSLAGDADGKAGGAGGIGGRRAGPTEPSAANRDLHDYQNVLKAAKRNGLASDEDAAGMWTKAADNAYGSNLQLGFALDDAGAVNIALPSKYTEPLKASRETKLQQALDTERNNLPVPLRTKLDAVAITIVDLSGSAPHAWAGHKDDEFDFSGSLLKVAAVYAAFELRAAARTFAKDKGITTTNDLGARLKTDFDPKIKSALPKALLNNPKLVPRNPGAGQAALFPTYEKVLTVSGASDVAFESTFFTRLDSIFSNQNQNTGAEFCIHNLGYGYINAALGTAGFFDDTTGKGVWLAGDYSFGVNFPAVKILCTNDLDTAQGTTTRQLARMLTLLADKKLFDQPPPAPQGQTPPLGSSDDMLTLFAQGGSWFDMSWPRTTAPIRMTHAKVGEGALKAGGLVFSEGGMFHENAHDKDFVIVWQNLKGDADIPALADLVKKAVTTYLA